MRKAGQDCPDKPVMPSMDVRKLRVRLIAEELGELAGAFNFSLWQVICAAWAFVCSWGKCVDPCKHWGSPTFCIHSDFACEICAADATADLRVVVTGTDAAMGIDGEPIDQEVHRSNMSKFIDGHRRADGKWIKGPSYSPANLAPIIEGQKV